MKKIWILSLLVCCLLLFGCQKSTESIENNIVSEKYPITSKGPVLTENIHILQEWDLWWFDTEWQWIPIWFWWAAFYYLPYDIENFDEYYSLLEWNIDDKYNILKITINGDYTPWLPALAIIKLEKPSKSDEDRIREWRDAQPIDEESPTLGKWYDVSLTRTWKTDWEKEDRPFYRWIGDFGFYKIDDWYEYYYYLPRWSWKDRQVTVYFTWNEFIEESDLDESNTEYLLEVFETRDPYYPYFLVPKIDFMWSVDYMELWENFEIECRDYDHLIDLYKKNCNLWIEIDESEVSFILLNWLTIENLDDSDWCTKFSWYDHRYIIRWQDIWCRIWINDWAGITKIDYDE